MTFEQRRLCSEEKIPMVHQVNHIHWRSDVLTGIEKIIVVGTHNCACQQAESCTGKASHVSSLVLVTMYIQQQL